MQTEKKPDPILGFGGKYSFLRNDYKCEVFCWGQPYGSVQEAYEALSEDWPKLDLMQRLIDDKFIVHQDLTKKLIQTYPRELVNINSVDDSFWGVCRTGGENRLGIALMSIRERLLKVKSNREMFLKQKQL